MQTLIKTIVLTVLVSFCAPISLVAAADAAVSTGSITAAKARSGSTSRKKSHKPAAKRDPKKAAKTTAHEL